MITEVPRFTRICAETGQEIVPGQAVYSLLLENNDQYIRKDYCVDAWKVRSKNLKNPEEKQDMKTGRVVGWWKHKVPLPNDKKAKQAPNDILIKIFEDLADRPDKQEMRYVIALLLIRRRIFRLERDKNENKMIVYAPKTDTTHEVLAIVPEEEKMDQIQNELMQLLSE